MGRTTARWRGQRTGARASAAAPGQGLLLDGSGHVQLGSVPDFDFSSGAGTVEGWVRADWTSSSGITLACSRTATAATVIWSMHMNSDKRGPIGIWNGSAVIRFVPVPNAGHELAPCGGRSSDSGNRPYYWDGSARWGRSHMPLGGIPSSVQTGFVRGVQPWPKAGWGCWMKSRSIPQRCPPPQSRPTTMLTSWATRRSSQPSRSAAISSPARHSKRRSRPAARS